MSAPSLDDRLAVNLLRRGAIGDMLTRQAGRRGSESALIATAEDGSSTTLSYAELERISNRLAHALIALGASHGETVTAMGSNGVEIVLTYLATLKTGAVFSTLNPALTASEVAYQLSLTRPRVIVHDHGIVSTLREALLETGLDPFLVPTHDLTGTASTDGPPDVQALIAAAGDVEHPDVPPPVIIEEHDPAMVIFTSGTERRPKGVVVSHRAFLMSTSPGWAYTRYVVEDDIFLLLAPLYTMAGVGTVTNLVSVGATIVLVPRPDPELVLAVIEDRGITNMAQTPTFYRRLVGSERFGRTNMRSLRQCHVYGGLVTEQVIRSIQQAAPESTWATYWGQTELSQLGTVGFFRSLDEVPDHDLRWIGRPVPQVEVRVVDEEDREVEVGELVCRGPGVMLGYLGAEEATSHVIRNGWLRTGDLVRRNEHGDLFFLDRIKDVIKTGGMNVSSLEVEQAIARDEQVREVAVVGVPDAVWGEAVVALVVLARSKQAPLASVAASIISGCRIHLASYKMPKRIHIVDALPYDAQGKLRKRTVREFADKIERDGLEATRDGAPTAH